MHFLSYADVNFLVKFKNQQGLFPTSLYEPLSLNGASFATSIGEEMSRELLHWRKWGEERRGEQLAQQQGQTFVLATPNKSSSKQKDLKMKEAGLFLSKTSLLPWACTASLEEAGMQTWDEWHQSKSPGSRSISLCGHMRSKCRQSTVLAPPKACGGASFWETDWIMERKKKTGRQCKCHWYFC